MTNIINKRKWTPVEKKETITESDMQAHNRFTIYYVLVLVVIGLVFGAWYSVS